MLANKLTSLFQTLKRDALFFIIFIVFAGFYYDSVLEKSPLGSHLWRQTDCLSITRSYARGAAFLEPEMNIQLADQNMSGKTAGEFPILYYAVGQLWKVFGESQLIYRLFYLFILFFGVYAFYKSLRLLLKDTIWSISIALLLFTSPVLVVFGVSYLTDVPAFAFVLIALYYLVRYHLESTKKLLVFSLVFFALAGLIKASSLIAFVFFLFILFLETCRVKTLGTKKVFKANFFEWAGFGMVILSILSWYLYAAHYNEIHRLKYTFNDIYPLWKPEAGGYPVLWDKIANYTSYIFFHRSILWLMGGLLLFHFFLFKKIPLFAYLSTIIVALGATVYILFWGPLLGVHDYYYAALLILFPGILVPFLWFIKTQFPKTFSGWKSKTVVGILVVFNFIYCLNIVKLKTIAESGEFAFVGNKQLAGGLTWTNWDVRANLKRFEWMKPYLLQIGIKPTDKVITLPDGSFNVTLYLMDRKGWTDFEHYSTSEEIDKLISKGAKYLFISDPKVAEQPFLQPFIQHKVGEFEGVLIYKLDKTQ